MNTAEDIRGRGVPPASYLRMVDAPAVLHGVTDGPTLRARLIAAGLLVPRDDVEARPLIGNETK